MAQVAERIQQTASDIWETNQAIQAANEKLLEEMKSKESRRIIAFRKKKLQRLTDHWERLIKASEQLENNLRDLRKQKDELETGKAARNLEAIFALVMEELDIEERNTEEVGRNVHDAPPTSKNNLVHFEELLPAAPSEQQLQAFLNALPQEFCLAYNTPPANGGFKETLDVKPLNNMLVRAIGAWICHQDLQGDSGLVTEPAISEIERELSIYIGQRKVIASSPQTVLPGTSAKAPAAAEAPLLAVLPCGHIPDTHAKDLANPAQQPDRLILAGPRVDWGNVVVGIENKDSLQTPRELNTGRGQLKKLWRCVFAIQTTRLGMVAMLMSCQHLELCVFRNMQPAISSGVQQLSMAATSPGLRLLFRVFSASPGQLGSFRPTLPAGFELDGYSFGGFERLTPWGAAGPAQAAAPAKMATRMGELLARLQFGQQRARQVFTATTCKGVPAEDAIVKFYDGAHQEADVLHSLSHIPYVPKVLAVGRPLKDWPDCLAMAPRAKHFTGLENSPAILLTGLRDAADALLQVVQSGWLHGNVLPGNLMLAGGSGGELRLLLIAFHGAARLGSLQLPTTETYSAVGLSQGEPPSLMTDLEACFHSFLHITTKEGLFWSHVLRSYVLDRKVSVMARKQKLEEQLSNCPNELKPAFRDLRELFWPKDTYREVPTAAGGEEAAQHFKAICEGHLISLLQIEQGMLGSGGGGGGTSAPHSPPAAIQSSMGSAYLRLRSAPRVAQKAQPLIRQRFLGGSALGWMRPALSNPAAIGMCRI